MAQPNDYDPLDLLGQANAAADKSNATALDREQFVDDFKWLLAHKQGRRLAWWLLSEAGVFRNPWRASTNEMAFAAGVMNQGQMILAEILAIAPDQFTTMMKEAHDDAKRRSGRNK